MAVAAKLSGVMWDREPRVIKGRAGPRRSCVTRLARRWKSRCHVIRVRRSRVIDFVARVAIGRNAGVIASDVAVRTRHRGVSAGQREYGLAVIEGRRLPGTSVMADFARLRESGLHVIRVRSAVEIFQVTRRAGRAEARKHIVHMTIRTRHWDVSAGQRKRGVVVIEHRPRP